MSENFPPPPPAYPPNPGFSAPPPNNNLALAIIATVLCCLPLGIVGIVKSAEVNGKWAQGDFAGAQASADAAKKWSIASMITAGTLGVLYVLFVVVIGMTSS